MLYSDLYFRSKRRTSLVLVVMAVSAVLALTYIIYNTSSSAVPTKAAKRPLKRHEVVNVSMHQIGIFWQSDVKEVSWIVYGEKENDIKKVALDERDIESKKNQSYFHFVNLKNLEENKTYYYKIVTEEGVITAPTGDPFKVTTTKTVTSGNTLKPAYGKVITPNGQAATNTFVLIHYKNAYPLATITKLTGEWLIPLQQLINKETNSSETITENDKISIEIFNEEGNSTVINALVKRSTPLPQTIVLGKNYTFFEQENVLPASTSIDNGRTYPISILFPKQGAVIPGNKPLLKGLAIPGKTVKIRLNSQPGYVFNITTDSSGEWNANIPTAIPAGSYLLSMQTKDKNDNDVTIKRNFSIGKSGEQVLAVSTPSASITVSPTTGAGTPIPTTGDASPTPTPTTQLTPEVTITLTPTQPVSGFDTKPFLLGSMALLVLGAGMLFIF